MPLVNAQDLLQHAYQNQYAVAGIGITDFELAQAAITAASITRAPIIFNLVAHHQAWFNLTALIPSLISLAKTADIPVAIHFDHATSMEAIDNAIRAGCNSVMFEPSSQNLLENQTQIAALQQRYAPLGIALETVAGHVDEQNIFTAEMQPELPTQPATAKYLATRAQPTALAVSVGNQHGLATKAPKIDFARLKRIHQDTECPLVIHGGSGLTEDQCVRLTRKGVAKINFFSDLAKIIVEQRKKAKDYFSAAESMQTVLVEQVSAIMRLVGSAGRAAEILQQCRLWPTRQLIISAQFLSWTNEIEQNLQPIFDNLQQLLPSIQSVHLFVEHSDTELFNTRVEWLLQLNQAETLTPLQNQDMYQHLLNQLRGLATEVSVCQSTQ